MTDKELQAMTTLTKAFLGLDTVTVKRILEWAEARFLGEHAVEEQEKAHRVKLQEQYLDREKKRVATRKQRRQEKLEKEFQDPMIQKALEIYLIKTHYNRLTRCANLECNTYCNRFDKDGLCLRHSKDTASTFQTQKEFEDEIEAIGMERGWRPSGALLDMKAFAK